MKVLVLNHDEVTELLTMRECIGVMEEVLAALARGEAYMPLRMVVTPPTAAGDVALMPSYRGGSRAAYGLKAVCFFPSNPERGLDSHQGAVLLFSAQTGELQAVMNASAITAIRTAAVSGVATKLLANEGPFDLAMLGAGVQARAHLESMSSVRKIDRVRVASKRRENAEQFASELQSKYPFPIEAVDTVQEAVRGARLIVTATTAERPILKREWIEKGSHLNVVGSSIPTTSEIDSRTLVESSLFVDRRESTMNEGGEYLAAVREGLIGPDHIKAEIGELLIGAHQGRTSPDEITLFKSLGLAVEDLASAQFLYDKAQRIGGFQWVNF